MLFKLNYTEDQLAVFTEQEKALLGKMVKSIREINYNDSDKIIPADIYGRIVDFGKCSGDPLIDWNSFKGFAVLNKDIVIVNI